MLQRTFVILFDFEIRNHVLICRYKGEALNAGNSIEFRDEIIEKYKEGNELIAVDLGAVKSIDSGGIGAMLTLHKAFKESGELTFFNVQAPVKNVLKLTRMEKLFNISDNLDDALISLEW